MRTVFTNGCFDILHPGHIELLRRARSFGDRLIVGINSDSSVRAIKGEGRPVNSEEDRKTVLEALVCVDEVVVFEELTPAKLIQDIKPDVLVKGGDWDESEIIGADFVRAAGGEVRTVPLLKDFSTSRLVESLRNDPGEADRAYVPVPSDPASAALDEHLQVFQRFADSARDAIVAAGEAICETIDVGGKVLLCGNGGSAADAQHIAAEFVGRYENERRALPAIALTTDTSALTALSNDYGFDNVFSRQVEALANRGDVLVAISTSGSSKSVINAMMKARDLGCRIIGLTGQKGLKFAALCDVCVVVPSERTSRIQEAHITTGHIWCEMVDRMLKEDLI